MICNSCGKKVYFGLFEPAGLKELSEKHQDGSYVVTDCIKDNFCPECDGSLKPENSHDKELLSSNNPG